MSEASYTVRIEGLEELQERLRRFPEISREELGTAMQRVVITLANNIAGHTPVYMNRLKPAILGSPKVEMIGAGVRGTVDSGDIPYALGLEIGPAARWPEDMEALRRWCKLVLGDEGLALAVASALAEGRSQVQKRPYAMFARGWVETVEYAREQFVGARDRMVERLAGK